MNGRIIATVWGEGAEISRKWAIATFWWSALELPWHWWVCNVACCCVTMSVWWGSVSTGSWIFYHLEPSWFSSVFIISYGYVILLKAMPCPLPSCFRATLSKATFSKHFIQALPSRMKMALPVLQPFVNLPRKFHRVQITHINASQALREINVKM